MRRRPSLQRTSQLDLLCEVYAMHEILRRLGFLPDVIFVSPGPLGVVSVLLCFAGKEVVFPLGRSRDVPAFLAAWSDFIASLGVVEEELLQTMYTGAAVYQRRVEIVDVLTHEGVLAQLTNLN